MENSRNNAPGPDWAADRIHLDTATAVTKGQTREDYDMLIEMSDLELAYVEGELDLLLYELGRD